MKNKYTKVICFFILIIFTLSGCSEIIHPNYVIQQNSLNEDTGKIRVSGSTSMTKLNNALSEPFHDMHPGIIVEKSDTGSGAAVDSVVTGTALIGELSRDLNEEEKAKNLKEIIIAYDGIAIIVNKENKLNELSYSQLQSIFTRKITNWKEFSGENKHITLIGREEGSGTKQGFESALNIESKAKYDVQYQENGDIISRVINDPSAIGYCSLFSVSDKLKLVNIDGVTPSNASIISGEYKIVRPFIEIYDSNKKSNLIDFWFEFIKSDVGRNIIIDQGLVPTQIEFWH